MRNLTILSILIFFFLIRTQGIAQTNVSGFISANTNWNLAGSPYIVIGNALVSSGVTLTIDPGVVVKFDTNRALQIDGELIAIGTAQNRITFTSSQIVPAAGDWAKLHFGMDCIDAILDTAGNYVSGSIMKYCDVKYAGRVGFASVHIESSSPYITHCSISLSGNGGIYSDLSGFVIDFSSIRNCAAYGLKYIDPVPGLLNGDLVFHDDTIENCVGAAYFGNTGLVNNNRILITKNYVRNNQGEAGFWFQSTVEEVIIRENEFIQNTVQEGLIMLYSQGYLCDFSCNKFISNITGTQGSFGSAAIHTVAAFSGKISRNVFDGNSSSNYESALQIWSEPGSDPLEIKYNIFRNNSSPLKSCCLIYANLTTTNVLFIHHNDFKNNFAQSVLKIEGTSPGVSNPGFIYLKHNNFTDPQSRIELYNNVPFGSSNVNADSNYWGSTSPAHLDSAIYDYFNYANLSVVYYSPVYQTIVPIDSFCVPDLPLSKEAVIHTRNDLMIFPNPAHSNITLSFGKTIEKGSVEIYNLLGDNVLSENIDHSSGKEINLNGFTPGIYLVNISEGAQRITRKLVVE